MNMTQTYQYFIYDQLHKYENDSVLLHKSLNVTDNYCRGEMFLTLLEGFISKQRHNSFAS